MEPNPDTCVFSNLPAVSGPREQPTILEVKKEGTLAHHSSASHSAHPTVPQVAAAWVSPRLNGIQAPGTVSHTPVGPCVHAVARSGCAVPGLGLGSLSGQ